MTPPTPWTADWHLRAELARLVSALCSQVQRQRARSRTPAGDAVLGMVIEDGEAEGLVSDLIATWGLDRSEKRVTPHRAGPTLRAAIAERAALGAAHGAFLPLRHAAHAFELRPLEYDALILALAVEIDPRFGRLVAYLNDHIARTRPTIGLVFALAEGEAGSDHGLAIDFTTRPAVRDGLLDLEGDGPVPGVSLRVSPDLLSRLASIDQTVPAAIGAGVFAPNPGLLDRLVLDETMRESAAQWADAARRGARAAAPLLIAGGRGSGGTALAHAVVSVTGKRLVTVASDATRLEETIRVGRRESRWHDAALSLEWREGSPSSLNWGTVWRELQTVAGPLVMTLPPALVEQAAAKAPREPLVLQLPMPAPAQRARIWRIMLPPGATLSPQDIDHLAARFRFAPGRIARTIRLAAAGAARRPPAERHLTLGDVEAACRTVGVAEMSALAQKMPLPYGRTDLVVPLAVEMELDLAVAWVRERHTVLEQWGFARRIVLGRGLTALFTGKPGTGKTMAAQVLARELGCDLYRVDLSRVMSKYIGETEKNLAQLFDEAQASGAILFFDEADALFGKRSEVKDAHDRYANVEIGYLLQRMEDYEGVTILATNRMRDLDEAFVRRFQVLLRFPMPEAPDRLRLWEGMIPAQAARAPDLDLGTLAQKFEVSGGEIRNVVLAAAYLAAGAGVPIGMGHLKRALRRELGKSGRVLSKEELTALEGENDVETVAR